MTGRAFSSGVLGWLIPGIVTAPLGGTHESAGGQALLFAGAAWLLLLGPIGNGVGFGIGVATTRLADGSGAPR